MPFSSQKDATQRESIVLRAPHRKRRFFGWETRVEYEKNLGSVEFLVYVREDVTLSLTDPIWKTYL